MFVYTKCGTCCRNIDRIPELSEYHIGNGVCIYLTEDNMCSIYDMRPDICNVDLMYEKVYRNIMTENNMMN